MKSILFEIQDSVIDYANVISKISHVDVEVMEKDFYRVAGTGIFQKEGIVGFEIRIAHAPLPQFFWGSAHPFVW